MFRTLFRLGKSPLEVYLSGFPYTGHTVQHAEIAKLSTQNDEVTFRRYLGGFGFPCGFCRVLVRDVWLIPAKYVPLWLTYEQKQRQLLAAKTELCYSTFFACHFASIVILLVSDNETVAVRALTSRMPLKLRNSR